MNTVLFGVFQVQAVKPGAKGMNVPEVKDLSHALDLIGQGYLIKLFGQEFAGTAKLGVLVGSEAQTEWVTEYFGRLDAAKAEAAALGKPLGRFIQVYGIQDAKLVADLANLKEGMTKEQALSARAMKVANAATLAEMEDVGFNVPVFIKVLKSMHQVRQITAEDREMLAYEAMAAEQEAKERAYLAKKERLDALKAKFAK